MSDKKKDRSPVSEREKGICRVTLAGSVGNLLLVIFKFAAGIFGHSAAMIADAVHSLSDFATDIVVVVFVRISAKPADEDHDYGYGKYETLATAVIGLVLCLVAVGIFRGGVLSVWRFLHGEALPRPGLSALTAALVSVVVKEALYHYTVIRGKRLQSQVVVANAWHHRSDALSSVGTALGIGGAMFLGEKWRVLDPLAAIVVSLFILKVAIQLLKPCLDELLEKSLPREVENRIRGIILSFPGVSEPHHLRTRRIGNRYAIEVHVRMDGDLSLHEAHDRATAVERRLKAEFGPDTHVGLHVEPAADVSPGADPVGTAMGQ